MIDPKELIGEKIQYIGRAIDVCWFGFGDLREKHDYRGNPDHRIIKHSKSGENI